MSPHATKKWMDYSFSANARTFNVTRLPDLGLK